jgi:anthranilate phosphoribosyltransferase
MKHAAPVRRELGFRTIFNLLGPLNNSASPDVQTVGVFNRAFVRPIAETLRALGSRRAFVFHGAGGLDEISLLGPTETIRLRNGRLSRLTIDPRQAGLRRARLEDIRGGTPEANAEIARRVLSGESGAYRDGTILSAAFALIAAGKASTPREGAEMAGKAIDSGRTRRLLDRLVEETCR